jgi:hypothetical protein
MNKSEKILYHYTSLEGLLGIIKSKSIWASSILYLNDSSELNNSIDLLNKILNSKNYLMPSPENWFRFINKLWENINLLFSSEQYNFYVCSFSEENDLLSQWQGYCPRGIGFSLGFKFGNLKECAKGHGYKMKKCNYDEYKQKNKLGKVIYETFQKYANNITQNSKDSIEIDLFANFYMRFFELAPTFKHHKFKAEKEWRIIADPPHVKKISDGIKFRSSQSMVVPYIEIPLPKEGDNLIINKIVVGPTHEPRLSKASVEMLLRAKNVRFDEVQYSTIPYRNW